MMQQEKLKRVEKLVRMPADVAEWIEAQAELTCASQSSEIVRCVRRCMMAPVAHPAAEERAA